MNLSTLFAEPSRRRLAFLITSAVVVVLVVVLAHEVMLPFVIALVIAYVLTPLVATVEKRRVPRAGAILIVYIVVLGVLGGGVRAIAPRIVSELGGLRRELPQFGATIRDEWIPAVQQRMRGAGLLPPPPPVAVEKENEKHALVAHVEEDGTISIDVGRGISIEPTKHGGYVVEPPREKEAPFDPNQVISDAIGKSFAYAQNNALELARIGQMVVSAISRSIFVFGITLMLAAYMMLTRERILDFFRSLVRPSNRPEFESLLARIDRGLSGVVRGQLIICLINGLLTAVGFGLVGLKYWPVLAVLATVFSLIPIFGVIISSIPAVALGLTQSFGTALFVLLWIVGVHQVEANVLNPKIMGDQAKLHPVLVIFSLLVGEHFFQMIGALLAVPCMSLAQSVFVHIRKIVERNDPEFAAYPPNVSDVPPPLP